MTKKATNHRHLLGAPVIDHIIDEVRTYADAGGKMGKIVSIAVDGNAELEVYIRNQARMAARVGLDFDQQMWSRNITQDECKSRIQDMNGDPSVLGIIIQRPLPSHINIRLLQSAVHVGDVDTAAVAEGASWITPVPGGVGPVTVAVLMRNAKTAHMRQTQIGWRA